MKLWWLACLSLFFIINITTAQTTDTTSLDEWKETDESYITLINSIYAFDNALIKEDTALLNRLLDDNVEITHSNGWVQQKQDVLGDFADSIVSYENVSMEKLLQVKRQFNITKIIRNVAVKGQFKTYPFDMKLQVNESWIIDEQNKWKLLTRKSEKI